MSDITNTSLSEDEGLKELLASLRQVEPSLASRVQNRTLIAIELAPIQQGRNAQSPPWWRRSVSLPVSLVLAACVLLVATTIGWLQELGHGEIKPVTAVNRPRAVEAKETISPVDVASAKPRTDYYATATYLCGVGQISTESVYSIKEH